MELLSEILEILMVVSFGASWPINGRKAFKARTAKGTSPLFLCLILFGYVCGIASKFINIGLISEAQSGMLCSSTYLTLLL